ncbi:TPA: hypothetical protein N0F65_010037 [Lagenidium giganteum]|uniref:Uncharacterized protein n=1 Tax=Lagenidium giganteum TaxID=4803 RepID=A0AAV2ZDW6_9STRA|nr:TPA: hypothetical protein N0F65_010037 [Lagenidium giganteum]
MSADSPYRSPCSTSGAIQATVPTSPVMVSSSVSSRLMPKSLNLAVPCAFSSTLRALRSRWMMAYSKDCR